MGTYFTVEEVYSSVVDPDPVGSALFGRIWIRIVTEKTVPERIRVALKTATFPPNNNLLHRIELG